MDQLVNALEPLEERKSAGQIIFERLWQAITCGDIPNGSRIVENEIASRMGVSRTPVREAIHKLEREGLVIKRVHGGYSVTGLVREDIQESFGIRSVLEGYAARLATIEHTSEDLKPLSEKICEFETRLQSDDLEALPKINTDLHDMLYSLSGNRRLIKIINDFKNQFLRFRKIILKDRALARISQQDHHEMLAMMRERRADDVERLVREHILRGMTAVLDQYDRQQLDPLT
ncbi:MAG: GntR family transcriptional regulator [Desulfomonilaceae bacterium]|nr:GntR family transcriptional regulator [Syntrophaceae bacterium]